jgi:hypothetical protein
MYQWSLWWSLSVWWWCGFRRFPVNPVNRACVVPVLGELGLELDDDILRFYWTLSSIGWGAARFAERTAVMIIAPAAPNRLLLIFVGFGMGFGLFAGPDNAWLTFLPAAIAALVIIGGGGDLQAAAI